ncbi:hypothetical protein JMA_40050 (plasmid) [Jeotgalibacillus malaysiensis]|uniref:Uncharacterized protein n=1 Tax=Jeotgalibacillus malaysiensis TaxID=1508404 RepID=A0A0B5AXR9_9BACL|nr:hypothetical protein [Jeotgalibacillus malaysiensis]AJD93323.1 hypothetical protein JMA_40050 [Jeotgalibacillus malaysiensis]
MKTFVFHVKSGDSTFEKTASGHTAHEAEMKLIFDLSHDGVVYETVELKGEKI